MFKIVSCGWQCAQFMDWTIQSVLKQERDDWEMMIMYDLSTDVGADILYSYSMMTPKIRVQINKNQNYAPHNQYAAVQQLAPDHDDIIIWLDLDGDQLAHPGVLDTVANNYLDDTLLTYGSYRASPPSLEAPRVLPYPEDVIASNSYRMDALYNGARFNHLRTMKGRVALSIPEDQFQWSTGMGWYLSGADYMWMLCGLERAAGRYKVIGEELCVYNAMNPLADNLLHGQETHQCDLDFMHKPPLGRLS